MSSSPAERIFARAQELINSVQNAEELFPLTERIVRELLQREGDQQVRDNTLEHVRRYFTIRLATPGDATAIRLEAVEFSSEVVAIIVRLRRKRGDEELTPEEIKTYFGGDGIWSPPPMLVRSRATAPTSVIIVPPPRPETHTSFDRFFAAALRYRVGMVSTFFHRWNPRVHREMPLPFILAVPFGANLDRAIEELIAPAMLRSRQIRQLETRYNWSACNTADFWRIVERDGHMEAVRQTWQGIWDGFRPQPTILSDIQGTRTVLKAGPDLNALRSCLESGKYAMPEIRSREIDLLSSFLDPDYAREPLEDAWTKLRQTYEQEMDTRVYQDVARAGALRDSLLACFEPFSNPTAEFLAMLSYWTFPNLSLGFLIAFTHNHGSNRAARLRRIPYLMWYLDLPDAEEALKSDDARLAEAAERINAKLQVEREQEEQVEKERQARMMGVAWHH